MVAPMTVSAQPVTEPNSRPPATVTSAACGSDSAAVTM